MARSKAVSMAITANSTGLRSEIARVNKTLDTLGASAKKTARDLGVLKTIEIGKIAFSGISFGISSITGLGTSALEMASRVSTSVDSLNDLANRTGIALKPLQGLALAAKLAGIDTEAFGSAVTKMAVNIGKAAPGGAFEKSLAEIGISLTDLQGMDPEAQFSAISAAIGEIPTAAGRAAAAVEIFGKAGASLTPLFKDGAASLEELTARAERLGIILQDDQVANIAAMNDGFDLVSATIDGIIGQILGDLSPVVTHMLDEMLQFVEAFQGAGGATGGTAIAQAITDGILAGVKYFLEGIKTLEIVFINFAKLLDKIPGIEITAPDVGFSGAQTALTFVSNFERDLKQSRKDTAADKARREALPLMHPDNPATAAARADFDRQRMAAGGAQPSQTARKDLEQEAINFRADLALKLGVVSKQALVANDVRSSAGASQVASFRRMEDDPALDEARAATKKLEQINQKLEALRNEPVDMI